MKKIYILFLISFLYFNTAHSQNLSPVYSKNIHATNDVIYLYGNELTGRFWLDDTTSVGFDPYSYSNTWDGVIAMDTARKHLWHRVVKGAHPGRGNSGFAIDSNNDIYFGSATGQPYTTMFVDSIPISKAMYILKMNSQGDIIRIIEPDQVGANTWVRGVSLTVDDFDNLYVVGSFIQDSISFGGLPPIVANNNHRSFIVNVLYINQINSSVIVIEGKTIPIGKKYRDNFLKRLNLI